MVGGEREGDPASGGWGKSTDREPLNDKRAPEARGLGWRLAGHGSTRGDCSQAKGGSERGSFFQPRSEWLLSSVLRGEAGKPWSSDDATGR